MATLLPCLTASLCGGGEFGDIEKFRDAGQECRSLAQETVELSDAARNKGATAVTCSRDLQETLESFGDDVGPNSFVHIQKLVQDDKAKQTLDVVGQMDGLAQECAGKASAMIDALNRSIESLPDIVKEELKEEEKSRSLGDDETEVTELIDVDRDVEDLETCTRSARSMNIFSASTKGRDTFDAVTEKEIKCQTIFGKIKELAAAVYRIASSLAGGNCCEQLKAMAMGAKEIFQCIRLSKLIQQAAAAVRKLIRAIIHFIKLSWGKFKDFIGEFDAAKKIGRFVSNLNPLKTRVGQAASGVVGGLLGG